MISLLTIKDYPLIKFYEKFGYEYVFGNHIISVLEKRDIPLIIYSGWDMGIIGKMTDFYHINNILYINLVTDDIEIYDNLCNGNIILSEIGMESSHNNIIEIEEIYGLMVMDISGKRWDF